MTHTFYWIDAFSERRFAGNPAGVCLLNQALSDHDMQQFATELNLAETAFVLPASPTSWNLRWFTPSCEVKLCGHATLASAFALWHANPGLGPQLRFSTLSGELLAKQTASGIRITLPLDEPRDMHAGPELLAVLGQSPIWVGESALGVIAQLADERQVRNFVPDIAAISQLPGVALIITAASGQPQYDCVSRVFAPKIGINEDPVTGAAHCALAPLWAKRLGKNHLHALQASARSGELQLHLDGAQVHLTGSAHLVIKGECYV